jgi:molybdate transport system ATP-binding protein
VKVDGVPYADAATGRHLPAWQRDIGYVAQDYSLFPHLSVRENVAFGLKAGGVARKQVQPAIEQVLGTLGISDLAARLPAQLSGGQQQRVAMARALVLQPRLLLLDEPLSSLDLQTRRAVRVELRELLRRLPCITIFVTHNPVEALLFGTQIIVLDRGVVVQVGAREDLLRHPRSPLVAELAGTNLFVGRAVPVEIPGVPVIRTAEGLVAIGEDGASSLYLTVNPREVVLSRNRPDTSAQNVLEGTILEIIPEPPAGERLRVVLDTRPAIVAELTPEGLGRLSVGEGDRVFAAFKAAGVTRYS